VKYISWIISIPILAIAVIFAVNHRQSTAIDLWPLPMEVAVPLYMLVLVAIFIGFILGGVTVWWSQGRHRRRARERRYRVEQLEREISRMQHKLELAQRDLAKKQGPSQSTPPPQSNVQMLTSQRTGT
jgi:uncharacterized integral membrane protein